LGLGDELIDLVETLADCFDEIGVGLVDEGVVRGGSPTQIRKYGIQLIPLFL
jgi:hypothetical protein